MGKTTMIRLPVDEYQWNILKQYWKDHGSPRGAMVAQPSSQGISADGFYVDGYPMVWNVVALTPEQASELKSMFTRFFHGIEHEKSQEDKMRAWKDEAVDRLRVAVSRLLNDLNDSGDDCDDEGREYFSVSIVNKALSEIEKRHGKIANTIRVDVHGGVAYCDDPRVAIIDHDNH